jgi:hypothetical protein
MTPQKRNKLGKINRVGPVSDKKKRQHDTHYGDLVFFGREPSNDSIDRPKIEPEEEDKLWYPKR